jgi:hypothetical protein
MYANPADRTSSIEKDEIKLSIFILTLKSGACTNWNVVEAIFTAPLVVSFCSILENNIVFVVLLFYNQQHIVAYILPIIGNQGNHWSWASSIGISFFLNDFLLMLQ